MCIWSYIYIYIGSYTHLYHLSASVSHCLLLSDITALMTSCSLISVDIYTPWDSELFPQFIIVCLFAVFMFSYKRDKTTTKEAHREDILTGRSPPPPLIGHQTTIIQREDVTAAGTSPSIESQTTSSTVHQECITAGIIPMIERQATDDVLH